MSNIMQPEKSSLDNIKSFLSTISDVEIRSLLEAHLNAILAIGADLDTNRKYREAFFKSVQNLIEKTSRTTK